MSKYNKRLYGAVLVKSFLANYNADFTGAPRTLPDGRVYSTDKALKYLIRFYLKHHGKIVFYTTRYKENMQPMDLDETYEYLFGGYPKTKEIKKKNKESDKKFQERLKKELLKLVEEYEKEGFKKVKEIDENVILEKKLDDLKSEIVIIGPKPNEVEKIPVIKNILKAIDIRMFGATFASKKIGNLSIHGNIQITHGINVYNENNIFLEDVVSPFRNPNEKSESAQQTTKGHQIILEEGHYLHSFTINPKNSEELVNLVGGDGYLSEDDIKDFKEAILFGPNYYNSAIKVGVESEFAIFIELNDNKLHLPTFTDLIEVKKDGDKRVLNIEKLKDLLNDVQEKIDNVEVFIDDKKFDDYSLIFDLPKVKVKSLVSGKEISNANR
jgi:CRISPR-associated protein Csh2